MEHIRNTILAKAASEKHLEIDGNKHGKRYRTQTSTLGCGPKRRKKA
jgi:hypothetical protein